MARSLLRAGRWAVGCLAVGLATQSRADGPVRLDLAGPWALHAAGQTDSVPATVPGCVHTDLLAAAKIPDPFFGANAGSLKWVSDTPWTYARTFTPDAALLARKHVVLRCEGLDTIATLTLNGRPLGRADNMFRTWEFDAKPLLTPGANRLEITFTPVDAYVKDFVAAAKDTGPNTAYRGMANVRKALYSNGWDFAPSLATAGVYKPITLVGYDAAKLNGVVVDARAEAGRAATVLVRPQPSDGAPAGTRVRATVSLDGRLIAAAAADAGEPVPLTVPDPKLWWPNGMGERPLYAVRVELLDKDGKVLDAVDRRVGLRNIELLRPSNGLPLRLRVNGREMYCRGADWVPADMFLPRVTPRHQRKLLEAAAAANMNMLRTWGGGSYEDDAFYDACDELGLLVWHDFKFACNAYPGRNKGFAENVRQEVADQVTRLSPHPSLAVWSGNNEVEAIVHRFGLMSQADYDLFFGDLIGGGLKKLLPNANYVIGSPGEGDEHNWWVWHIGADFEKYRDSHGWMTEFGFESFPVPATVDSYTDAADRKDVLTPVMKAHQHNGNKRGNEMILDQMARYFKPAKDFDNALWLSQIDQAYGLRIGIEHWRGDWPKSSGSLVWQLNDCQPGPSWSMIDYYGRPKAAEYAMKAAYAPVLVTGVYDAKTDTLPLTLCSDLPEAFDADVQWSVAGTTGGVPASGRATVRVPAGTTAVAGPTPDLSAVVNKVGRRNLIVSVRVLRHGLTVASNTFLPVKPKDLTLQDPALALRVTPAGDGFDVELKAKKPALYAWLDLPGDPDAGLSDNFVTLTEDTPVTIHLKPSQPTDAATLQARLVARSLFDTFVDTPAADRAVRPGPDGILTAGVATAEIVGNTARLEKGKPPNIGGWTNAADGLEWAVDGVKPGTYAVTADVACPADLAGSRFEVRLGDAAVAAAVPPTDGWGDYRTATVGTLAVTAAGPQRLCLRVLSMKRDTVMNLRSLTLTPLR